MGTSQRRPPNGSPEVSRTGGTVSPELGRILLIVGVVLVVVGGLAVLGVRLPFGRLPGDIAIEGERGGFYVPIVTMIIVSVVLTVLFNIFLRR